MIANFATGNIVSSAVAAFQGVVVEGRVGVFLGEGGWLREG